MLSHSTKFIIIAFLMIAFAFLRTYFCWRVSNTLMSRPRTIFLQAWRFQCRLCQVLVFGLGRAIAREQAREKSSYSLTLLTKIKHWSFFLVLCAGMLEPLPSIEGQVHSPSHPPSLLHLSSLFSICARALSFSSLRLFSLSILYLLSLFSLSPLSRFLFSLSLSFSTSSLSLSLSLFLVMCKCANDDVRISQSKNFSMSHKNWFWN